jgi:hypothetical protein
MKVFHDIKMIFLCILFVEHKESELYHVAVLGCVRNRKCESSAKSDVHLILKRVCYDSDATLRSVVLELIRTDFFEILNFFNIPKSFEIPK